MTKETARSLLKKAGLRITAPRIAVLRALGGATRPLSHTAVLSGLGDSDWDPATVYRNLVKLRDSGLATVVSRAGGIDRYAFSGQSGHQHEHPHFVCDDCGRVECLPSEVVPSVSLEGRWAASVSKAVVQLRGECPDCLELAE